MKPAKPAPARRKWLPYAWLLVTALALVLAGLAYLHPYKPLREEDLSPQVRAIADQLDTQFGKPVQPQSFSYTTRRTYATAKGPVDVEIRATLQPLSHGLMAREDEWYDLHTHDVIYQERYILFRNLFAVHSRTREKSPLMHDLLGRLGWYNDAAQTLHGTLQGGTPDAADWALSVSQERISDSDGGGFLVQSTAYRRDVRCQRAGDIDGPQIGNGFTGRYPKVVCQATTSNQPGQRHSEYAYLADYGLFLLLGYQQQNAADTPLGANGRYLSFKALPL